jgi:DNA-binding MarR family transcriptional regulator
VSFLTHLAAIGGQSPFADLTSALEVNQPAASKHMRALKERGAIVVTGQTGDGRRRHVSLTDVGRALLADAHIAMHPEATLTFAELDDPDLESLLDTLSAVRAHLDRARSAGP